MAKYRKKPVVIEAEIYKEGLEDGFSCIPFTTLCSCVDENGFYKQCKNCTLSIPKKPYIETLEGNYYINKGDYIITGVKGERYPCKPDIFEETYEKVKD
jgi:hypothetical protein